MRRDVHVSDRRAMVALSCLCVMACRHSFKLRQVLPEHRAAVRPSASVPERLHRGILGIGHHRKIRVSDLVLGRHGILEKDTLAAILRDLLVIGRGGRIFQRKFQRAFHLAIRGVLDLPRKERGRQRGIKIVMRDKGIKGRKAHGRGKIRIRKGDTRHGKAAVKNNVAKMREARHRIIVRAKAEADMSAAVVMHSHQALVGIAVQNARIRFSCVLYLDRKMRISVVGIFIRAVEDLPIDQHTVAAEADRARSDAAQREGYIFRLFFRIKHTVTLNTFYFNSIAA